MRSNNLFFRSKPKLELAQFSIEPKSLVVLVLLLHWKFLTWNKNVYLKNGQLALTTFVI